MQYILSCINLHYIYMYIFKQNLQKKNSISFLFQIFNGQILIRNILFRVSWNNWISSVNTIG